MMDPDFDLGNTTSAIVGMGDAIHLIEHEQAVISGDADENLKRIGSSLVHQVSELRNRFGAVSHGDNVYYDNPIEMPEVEMVAKMVDALSGLLIFKHESDNGPNLVARKGPENVPRHYAFLKLTEGEDRLARRDQLAVANIYPIWYTEDHDMSLEALLEKLAEGVNL